MDHDRWPPRLDLDAAGGVDLARLERSLGLQVRRIGRGRYLVTGGTEPHWVDLYTRRLPRCDCGDHIWRERVCKHILAVLLREGDERVIGAIARLVGELREAAPPVIVGAVPAPPDPPSCQLPTGPVYQGLVLWHVPRNHHRWRK